MAGHGIQREVLASLALVMMTAIGLLAAFFFEAHSRQLERLSPLLGRALREESRAAGVAYGDTVANATWFRVMPGVPQLAHAQTGEVLDAAGLSLARAARERGEPLLQAGRPWEPIRFATPVADGAPGVVGVAVLPPTAPGRIVLVLLLVDVLIFTWLASHLLRRRVVSPLRQLAATARVIEESGPGPRVSVEGVVEVVEVAEALSDMSEALERRNSDLEKAVAELREANASLRRARDGLDRSERLAAVGTLAAGVAHEVGNPMGALLAFLDLAQRDETMREAPRGHLQRAVEQGLRVRRILGQLLDFSRPPRSRRVEIDLGTLAEQAVDLLRAQGRYRDVAFDVVGDAPSAVGDESIVAQILLNLVGNAADAVAGVDGPRVRVRLSEEEGFASCRVEDNGRGIPEADLPRIFDPFFTTKPPGEGTGLGLANALRFAEELGGGLGCGTSAELGGAAFSLRLPRPGATGARAVPADGSP